jgi:hypothetical protein
MSLAEYLWRFGSYVYAGSVDVTPGQKERYAAQSLVALPADFPVARERCAVCGKWTPDYAVGAVSCRRCAPVGVCFGRTSPDRYFECRASCPEHGYLTATGFDRVALVPGAKRRNFGTDF